MLSSSQTRSIHYSFAPQRQTALVMAEEAPNSKKQCVVDLRGEDSDDSSVICIGSAPAPPAAAASAPAQPAAFALPAASKSIKVMKETIRAAGLGVADLVERSDVEARYKQALARLEEADSRNTDDASTPYAWHPLQCPALGGPDSPGNRGAVSLSDVGAGRPKWFVVSNYMISGRTLEQILPQLKTVERCVIFHGEAGTARHLASTFPRAEIHDMTPKKLEFIHSRTGKPFKNDYGCHHAKFFLVGFEDSLRVSIHTANIINCDCFKKTQGVWTQDFPLKKAGAGSSDFEEQLVKYMKTLQNHKGGQKRSWVGFGAAFGDEQLTLADALRKFDFSGAKGRLVAATPGYHSGADLHLYGVNRLAALLANESDAASQRADDEIYCQFSSFSRPAPKLLAALSAAFHAPKPLGRPPPKVPLFLVWATKTEVRDSVEGYGAGSCMPSALKNVREAPRGMLRRWTKDGSSDFVAARCRAMPHIKTWTRVSGDGKDVRWSLLSSANLSGYAWGNHQVNNTQLFCGHWELGVLVTPSIIGSPLRTTQGTGGAVVPLPYPCPPRPYADCDVPFSWEERYDEPDRFGSHGTNNCIGKQVGK